MGGLQVPYGSWAGPAESLMGQALALQQPTA
jgi:hypothetical protein